jgi:hypothetical protein
MWVRSGLAVVFAAVSLAVAACGGTSEEDRVRAVLGDLAGARADGNAERACERDYVVVEDRPGAIQPDPKESREECVRALTGVLQRTRRSVRDYSETVNGIDIDRDGKEAEAEVHATGTRADGSRFARDIKYELVRRDGGWRVAIEEE